MLLRTAIAEGVEYIDLEGDVAGGIPRFGKTKRVVSYHNFRKTPDDLAAIHAAASLGRCRRREAGHDGQSAERQSADAAIGRPEQAADRRLLHGRHRHSVANSLRTVRFAVDLCHVSSRTRARSRAAQLPADERDLSLRPDRRMPRRPSMASSPIRSGTASARKSTTRRFAMRASMPSICRSACRPKRSISFWARPALGAFAG